jgi:hypothetical protein
MPPGVGALEAGGGIEPPIGDLQSPALPLCYPAAHLTEATFSRVASYRAGVPWSTAGPVVARIGMGRTAADIALGGSLGFLAS